MKQLATVVVLSAIGIAVWQLSYRLSSDALAMAIVLTFGLLMCVGVILLVVNSQRHEPMRRRDEDAPVVHVYNDNRQITLQAIPIPSPTQRLQWPQAQRMPLIADRQWEIQNKTEVW